MLKAEERAATFLLNRTYGPDEIANHLPSSVQRQILEKNPEFYVIDGYEVARQIRSQLPDRDLTLVALTGWGREEDRRSAQEAGFDAHLVKPLDFDALERILNKSCTDPKAKLS